MPRTLTAAVETSTQATVTRPVYLVEIGYATPLYLSSGRAVTWNGRAWLADAVSVRSLSTTGLAACVLVLPNLDNTASALVLNEGAHDQPVTVWALYPPDTDPVLLLDGVSDGASINPREVTIGVVAVSAAVARAPRVYCQPPLCNHAPRAGTVLTWGGERYTLE